MDEDTRDGESEQATAAPLTEAEVPAAGPAPLPEVTTAAAWRRRARRYWLIPLPSGAVVKARYPDWNRMILEGAIKQEEFLELSQGSTDFSPERYERFRAIAGQIIPRVVIEPVVVQANGHAPEDDAEFISVDQITSNDIGVLLFWSTGIRTPPGAREVEE